jgi:hypothetical protein
MDKATQQKIVIENGSASKLLKKLVGDPEKIPKFLKGKSTISVMSHPGNLSSVLKRIKAKGLIFPEDDYNLRKYFWDVDMSLPDNIYGAKEVKPTLKQDT